MATQVSETYSVVCHVCNQSVEIYGGDFKTSLDFHNLKAHPQMNQGNKNPTQSKKKKSEASSIGGESYNKSLPNNFESHSQINNVPRSDDQLYTFDGIRNWIDHSENSDSRSTSSRDNTRRQRFPNSPLNGLPMGIKQHRGFFTENKDSIFCNICRSPVESTSIQEHIKTKTHEDNVVLCLKRGFPAHLQNAMEFVSFYGSNLCCNLCRTKIDLSSFNIHETIVNILFHNADACHTNKKSKNQNVSQDHSNDSGIAIIKTLAAKYPQIDEDKNLIKSNIEPQFKCIWCDKNILYSAKEHALAQNFIAHFNSSVHKKSKAAFIVLKAFRSLNLTGYENHKLVIANGSITCIQCKCKIEADITKLVLHMSETKPIQGNSSGVPDSNNSRAPGSNNSHQNKPTRNQQKVPKAAEKKKGESNPQARPTFNTYGGGEGPLKVSLQAILGPLEQEFGKISCIIQKEKEEGMALCLICNCPIPSTTQNVRMHLTGNSHLRNVESQLGQVNNAKMVKPIYASSTVNELFYPLPFNLQDNKKYIKDSPIDGYIICSLCNQGINPKDLRAHLLDRKHILQKQAVGSESGLLDI